MTTRVAIVGGTGKLGGIIRDVIEGEEDFEVYAALSSKSELSELDGADLVVDASSPAVSIDVVRAAVERRINVLVGTSGWSAERIALVRPLVDAAGTAAVFIPNFSLGSVLGSALAAAAAPFFPSIEIVEAHRETKVDSPSGTAVRTAELIAAARAEAGPVESPHVDQRARGQQVASVPIHSLRRPGVVARQEVVLSGPGESLTLIHDTVEPALGLRPRHPGRAGGGAGRPRCRGRARQLPRHRHPRAGSGAGAAGRRGRGARRRSHASPAYDRTDRRRPDGGAPGAVHRARGAAGVASADQRRADRDRDGRRASSSFPFSRRGRSAGSCGSASAPSSWRGGSSPREQSPPMR